MVWSIANHEIGQVRFYFSSSYSTESQKSIFKESKNCSIPTSFQVPLSDQQDEEVAVFLRQFTAQV